MADLKKTIEILFQGNDQASRSAAAVLEKVAALEAASVGASGAAARLGGAIGSIGGQAVNGLPPLLARMSDLAAATGSATTKTSDLGLSYVALGAKSNGAADVLARMRELEAAAAKAKTESAGLGDKLDDTSKRGVAGFGLLNAAVAVFAVKAVLDRFIDVNVQLEKFDLGLKAINGRTTDTSKEFEFVRGVADKFGLSLGSLSDGYLRLTAASKGTVLEGQATRDIFEAVQRAMGALGRSTADTDGVIKALIDIMSKGTVQAEELKNQLGDRLPGAMGIAARAMGVTTTELVAMTRAGLVTANDFLPKFAAELDRTFADASFNGYSASLNRLKNSIDTLLQDLGKAGAFDLLTNGVQELSDFVKRSALEFEVLGRVYEHVTRAIRDRSWDGLVKDLEDTKVAAIGASGAIDLRYNQSLAETARLMRQAQEVAEGLHDEFDNETAKFKRQSDAMDEANMAAEKYNVILKTIGINRRETEAGIETLARALVELTSNPRSNGHDWALAFETSLKRATDIESVSRLGSVLATLFADGKLSAATYQEGLKDLEKAFDRVTGATKKTKDAADEQAKAAQRQAAEFKRTEEHAQRMRLELEKLASNERIKNIEAKVKLNVAEIEAQTERIKAAFSSLDNTVTSTGDVLKGLFSQLKDFGSLDWGAIRLIEKQIDLENDRRQQALDMQRDLTRAQIDHLRVQSRQIEKGDSLIKITGDGLQPHLEAFMWEILRKVQVRVNQDGLKMLLGV